MYILQKNLLCLIYLENIEKQKYDQRGIWTRIAKMKPHWVLHSATPAASLTDKLMR